MSHVSPSLRILNPTHDCHLSEIVYSSRIQVSIFGTWIPNLAAAPAHTSHASVDPSRWYQRWWFPVLCLKRLALIDSSPSEYRALCKSVRKREWITCSFLWVLWCHRMKIAHEPDYFFSIDNLSNIFLSRLSDAQHP